MSQCIAILVRHGDYHQLANTPSAHQPFPLNDTGREQSEKAIGLINEMVAANGWLLDPVIHSSNLQRAWQTATIISAGLTDIDSVIGFDDLAERSLGSAANLTLEQIAQVIEQDQRYETLPTSWKSDSYFCLPVQGAESLMQAGKRVADHILKTVLEMKLFNDQKQVVAKIFVGHGAAFRHAAFQLGVLEFEQLKKLSMFHAQPVALQIDAEQNWAHVAGDWKVRSNNEAID